MARKASSESKGRLLVLSGLSGAGKTLVLHTLEDLGFYCVDNLPPSLIPSLIPKLQEGKRVAVVIDTRAGEPLAEVESHLHRVRQAGVAVEVLFLECADEILLRRFKETRRPHPLAQEKAEVMEAIALERERLAPLRMLADCLIDTTTLKPQDLRQLIGEEFASPNITHRLRVRLISFGYKYGLPLDADLVFDVRFLANPYYIAHLKPLDGTHPEIENFVLRDPHTQQFLEHLLALLAFSLPQYEREGKAYLTIAIGCTGGRHRSVVLAGQLRDFLEKRGYPVKVCYRDLEKDREEEGEKV